MKTTLEICKEAGFPLLSFDGVTYVSPELERLVALVRADQDEKYKWDIHSCGPTCKRYACVAMREAVEAEREACAKVCERMAGRPSWEAHQHYIDAAAAIRARGNT